MTSPTALTQYIGSSVAASLGSAELIGVSRVRALRAVLFPQRAGDVVLGAMLAHVPGECKPIGRTVRVHSVLVANLRGTGHLHIPQTDETGVVRSEDRTMQVWQKVLCRDTPGKTRCSIFANVITKGVMK